MLETIGAEKVDKENDVIYLASMLLPWSLNCPKRCTFHNFVLASARNLSLLKQFTCMHLKVHYAFSVTDMV